jgi:hypothetical protein
MTGVGRWSQARNEPCWPFATKFFNLTTEADVREFTVPTTERAALCADPGEHRRRSHRDRRGRLDRVHESGRGGHNGVASNRTDARGRAARPPGLDFDQRSDDRIVGVRNAGRIPRTAGLAALSVRVFLAHRRPAPGALAWRESRRTCRRPGTGRPRSGAAPGQEENAASGPQALKIDLSVTLRTRRIEHSIATIFECVLPFCESHAYLWWCVHPGAGGRTAPRRPYGRRARARRYVCTARSPGRNEHNQCVQTFSASGRRSSVGSTPMSRGSVRPAP